jgi:hypothetical protein
VSAWMDPDGFFESLEAEPTARLELPLVGDSEITLSCVLNRMHAIPEFYTGSAAQAADAYRSALVRLWEKDPGAAMWMADTGLFIETSKMEHGYLRVIDAIIEESDDPLRVLVSERVLRGGSVSDRGPVPLTLAFRLEEHLLQLPSLHASLSSQEVEAVKAIRRLIQMIQNREGGCGGYDLRKALYLIEEYGVPSSAGMDYPVPRHNTMLQVLLWVLSDVDITAEYWNIALAAALAYGPLLPIVSDEIEPLIRGYVASILNFLMETDRALEMDNAGWRVRDYPVEACMNLVWGAPATNLWADQVTHPAFWGSLFTKRPMTVEDFQWYFVSTEDLRSMRSWMTQNGALDENWRPSTLRTDDRVIASVSHSMLDQIIADLDADYSHPTDRVAAILNHALYFGPTRVFRANPREEVIVDGRRVVAQRILNPRWQWATFLEHGHFFGTCIENTHVEGMLLKSIGIAAAHGIIFARKDGAVFSHDIILYYQPESSVWRTTPHQAAYRTTGHEGSPPVSHDGVISLLWRHVRWSDLELEDMLVLRRDPAISHRDYGQGFPVGYIFRRVVP